MASATQLPGPIRPTSNTPLEKCEAQFELGITLSLFLWPSLALAVANLWGGPESSSKREFLAQATIDLLKENPDEDATYLEEFLLQFMVDEFEIVIEDDSAWEVSEQIFLLRKECERGDFRTVVMMKERWDTTGGRDVVARFADKGEVEVEGSDGEDEDGDVNMDIDEAPQLVRVKEKFVPEVDEDGFTTVSKKKR
jgi:pre-rRNA-processing protein TSR2